MYFDSNYVLKCYLPEPGAERVRALAARPVRKACSRFGRFEVLAALHRKLREGSLNRRQLKQLWGHLLADEATGVWHWLPFDRGVELVIEQTFVGLDAGVYLRTGDAIHLATASLHGFTEIWSHDAHVRRAASSFGLEARDVLQNPAQPT